MTIREAFESRYLPSSPGMTRRTIQKLRHDWNWFERFTGNPPVNLIGPSTFDQLRRNALEAGLSPVSIESVVSDVLSVLRHLVRIEELKALPWSGKRLKRRPQLKPTPSIEDLGKVYALCRTVRWPVHVRRLNPHCPHGRFKGPERIAAAVQWWKTLFALGYFTALRRSDLLTLRWDEIEGGWIRRKMVKTGFTIEIPVHPVLQTHLDALPTKERPCVLGYVGSYKQIRGEMKSLAAAAGVKPFSLQAVRRLSAQQFERARGGTGGLILGHQYRTVDKFYLDPVCALQWALPNLAVPEGMGPTGSNGVNAKASKPDALDVLRQLGREELAKLLGELLTERATA
jgi:integrase